MRKYLFGLIGFVAFGMLAGVGSVQAQVQVEVVRDYQVSNAGEMQVKEVENIRNTFKDRYIPRGTERQQFFVISAESTDKRAEVAETIYNSLSFQIDGRAGTYRKVSSENIYGIAYNLPRDLSAGQSLKIQVTYNHPELAERSGGILDAYIPAFSSDFQFSQGSTAYTYKTTLHLPSDSGQENIISVEPLTRRSEGGFEIYEFAQEKLKGAFVWVQRGSQQVFDFTLTQELPATENASVGNLDEYQVILPRDIAEVYVAQKVYFRELSPTPLAVQSDEYGNLIATYRKRSDEKLTVRVKGYAVVTHQRGELTSAGKLADVSQLQDYQQYLQPAEYWEVKSTAIGEFATTSVAQEQDVYKVVSGLYTSVVNRIDYSQVKRFGLNERQGALRTLQGGAAVCMEYSDLYLTLLRNRGVPARAVFGYGYDSRLSADAQEAHQWVQAYLPGYQNWASIDVTWGESGTQVIGGDLNHFYTHVAVADPNSPPVLSRLALSSSATELPGPQFSVSVRADLPAGEYLTPQDLLQRHPPVPGFLGDYYVQALREKFTASATSLFSEPRRIDMQGWLLLVSTIVLGVALLVVILRLVWLTVRGFFRVLWKLFSREPRPKPRL